MTNFVRNNKICFKNRRRKKRVRLRNNGDGFSSRNCVSRGANGESSSLEWRLFSNSRHKIINLIFRFEPSRCLCMRFSSLVPAVPFRPRRSTCKQDNVTCFIICFCLINDDRVFFPLSKSNSFALCWCDVCPYDKIHVQPETQRCITFCV